MRSCFRALATRPAIFAFFRVESMISKLSGFPGRLFGRQPGPAPEPAPPPVADERDDLVVGFNHSWSDDNGVGLLGWAFSKLGPVENAEIWLDGHRLPITAWQARPDLRVFYPDAPVDSGFTVYVPRTAEHHVRITATVANRQIERSVVVSGLPKAGPGKTQLVLTLFEEFKELANQRGLRVLEIGSRIVSPGSVSKRSWFHGARSYVGFDYYGDSNTDVVGDAHRLTDYVGTGQFDAIFSLSVFEHLAMPWVVAMEINKALAPGGFSFHSSHFAWPEHDMPWDFWRYSDEGLKVLFSSSMGFKTRGVGMYAPLRLHADAVLPGEEMFPLHVAYGGAAILSEKVAEIDDSRFRWQAGIDEILPADSHYPLESGRK
jgi:hypothetical protein